MKILLQAPFVVLIRSHGLTQKRLRWFFFLCWFCFIFKANDSDKIVTMSSSSQPINNECAKFKLIFITFRKNLCQLRKLAYYLLKLQILIRVMGPLDFIINFTWKCRLVWLMAVRIIQSVLRSHRRRTFITSLDKHELHNSNFVWRETNTCIAFGRTYL